MIMHVSIVSLTPSYIYPTILTRSTIQDFGNGNGCHAKRRNAAVGVVFFSQSPGQPGNGNSEDTVTMGCF